MCANSSVFQDGSGESHFICDFSHACFKLLSHKLNSHFHTFFLHQIRPINMSSKAGLFLQMCRIERRCICWPLPVFLFGIYQRSSHYLRFLPAKSRRAEFEKWCWWSHYWVIAIFDNVCAGQNVVTGNGCNLLHLIIYCSCHSLILSRTHR